MNLINVIEELELWYFAPYIIERRGHRGQLIFKFPNNYGASLVNHSGSYGNELAVIKWGKDTPAQDSTGFHLTYVTPVTDDVIGHIENLAELEGYLHQIMNLQGE